MNIRTRMIGTRMMRSSRQFSLLIASAALVMGLIAPPALAAGKGKPAPSADLSLSITDSPDPALLVDEITYAITISNAGPWSVSAVLQASSAEATVTSVTSSQGTCTSVTSARCELGLLARGATARVSVVVRPLRVGTVTLSGNVFGNQPDPNTSNNQKSESTSVMPSVPTVDGCAVDIPNVTPGPETGVEDFLESELCAVTELI